MDFAGVTNQLPITAPLMIAQYGQESKRNYKNRLFVFFFPKSYVGEGDHTCIGAVEEEADFGYFSGVELGVLGGEVG